MTKPLMPMATAVWLVENTALTFRQIANFCSLHELEVQAIADETVGQNIVGLDPVLGGQLTAEELERCVNDPRAELQIIENEVPTKVRTKGPRYTPVSRRQDKPDAIAWLLRHHPELSDPQICRLIGTTKPTITALRDRTHWNIQKITPQDPVALGLSRQIDLDEAVQKAMNRQKAREEREAKRVKKAMRATAAEETEAAVETGEENASEETPASEDRGSSDNPVQDGPDEGALSDDPVQDGPDEGALSDDPVQPSGQGEAASVEDGTAPDTEGDAQA